MRLSSIRNVTAMIYRDIGLRKIPLQQKRIPIESGVVKSVFKFN